MIKLVDVNLGRYYMENKDESQLANMSVANMSVAGCRGECDYVIGRHRGPRLACPQMTSPRIAVIITSAVRQTQSAPYGSLPNALKPRGQT